MKNVPVIHFERKDDLHCKWGACSQLRRWLLGGRVEGAASRLEKANFWDGGGMKLSLFASSSVFGVLGVERRWMRVR